VTCQKVSKSVELLKWLFGTWRCEKSRHGIYPTIKGFNYDEGIIFENVGQPMLNYRSFSWHAEKKSPIHFECGYLKVKPDTNEVSFLLSLNFGTFLVHFRGERR
jgi:hypothetical protein